MHKFIGLLFFYTLAFYKKEEKKDPNIQKTDDQVLKWVDFTNWVETSSINWYDGNVQKIRKSRLDKLLGRKA